MSTLDAATLTDAAEAACRAGLRAGLAELDARDLAQEALVRALTSSRPPDGVPLAAWVYGIAKNLGRDHWKSAQRRELLVEPPESSAHEDDLATVLSVRRAVDELPEPLRAVVTLHELEQHSLRETAEALQIPFDTAKDRLRRAREQLRASLGDGDVVASERAHTRRRAAVQGAAIVAGVCALLGDRALATAATATVAATAGRLTMRTWMAVTAGSALVAGGFAVGRLTTTTSTPTSHAAVAPPQAIVATVPVPDAADAVPDAVPIDAAVIQHAAAAASHPQPSDNQAERLLLDRARAGMQRGLYSEALVTLMSHARRFPDGALAEERDVLIIESYARSGQTELARRRIAQYRAAYPTGVLRTRVTELESTF